LVSLRSVQVHDSAHNDFKLVSTLCGQQGACGSLRRLLLADRPHDRSEAGWARCRCEICRMRSEVACTAAV